MQRSTPLWSLFLLLFFVHGCSGNVEPTPQLDSRYDEWTVDQFQQAMGDGELSAVQLVEYYLERIETIDAAGPKLNSIIEINLDALTIAEQLDEERAAGKLRGPLHGIPIVLKANVNTGDAMATSAGSLALADHHASNDAFIAAKLREAGAVLLGKTNLSEWANFRSTRSSSGWSSIGGQTKNAYDPLRNPCGSSSGSGVSVAANLTVLAIGTETDGSIVCPASINGIVGVKPTLGLVSRDGIIPIAHSQDTAGPMARSVRDAALMLNAISAIDTTDLAAADRPETTPDYAANLSKDALQGARIGVIRSYGGAGDNPDVDANFEAAVEAMRAGGAEIIDEIEIDTRGMGGAEYEVLLYEFKADLNSYLQANNVALGSIAEIIAYNDEHAAEVMPIFGQEIMILAESKGDLTDEGYLAALETSKRIARDGIDLTIAEHQLDALVAPTNGPAWMTDHVNGDNFSVGSSSLAAVSGYASVTVPSGYTYGLPLGISFIGGAFSEERLLQLAYSFEQATTARRAAEFKIE